MNELTKLEFEHFSLQFTPMMVCKLSSNRTLLHVDLDSISLHRLLTWHRELFRNRYLSPFLWGHIVVVSSALVMTTMMHNGVGFRMGFAHGRMTQ